MKKKKKNRVTIYIKAYEDPVKGCEFDLYFEGNNSETVALLFKSAVTISKRELYMSDDQIIDTFRGCVLGEHHD